MEVTLISYSQFVNHPEGKVDPISIVEQAACICYDSKPTKNFRIAQSCMASGHRSVFEHISFTFLVSGVTRALLAQLSRHRHSSLSVRSQRYCKEDLRVSVVEPDAIAYGDGTHDVFMSTVEKIADSYDELVDSGIQQEDARSLLPNACTTKMYITANARALIEMSGLRLCTRAQKEIRSMFKLIKEEVAKVSPMVASYMRPKCYFDVNHPFCTERECCGLAPRIEDVYVRKSHDGTDYQ